MRWSFPLFASQSKSTENGTLIVAAGSRLEATTTKSRSDYVLDLFKLIASYSTRLLTHMEGASICRMSRFCSKAETSARKP